MSNAEFNKGFSIIELMIVIAIIGILSAIAVPSYQNYVIKSKISFILADLNAVSNSYIETYATTGDYPPLGYVDSSLLSNYTNTIWSSEGLTNQVQILGSLKNINSDLNGRVIYMILSPNADGSFERCLGIKNTMDPDDPVLVPLEYLPTSATNTCSFVE